MACPLRLFVPEALNGGRKNGSSCCFGCVEEVSLSYYEDVTEASLFSPCLSESLAAVCFLYCLSTRWRCTHSACLGSLLLSLHLWLFVTYFFLCSKKKKRVDIAINKVQFKGEKINSKTLGLSFGVLQGHPLCNVLRN